MDLTSFHSQFRDETAENIRALNEGLLAIESIPEATPERREQVDAIFRAMHTIKGSARLLGFEDIGRIAHTCEHILGAVREGVLRRHMRVKGFQRDTVYFSILDEEWPAVKERLRARLAAG